MASELNLNKKKRRPFLAQKIDVCFQISHSRIILFLFYRNGVCRCFLFQARTLLSQGLQAGLAAATAVWAHGTAGDEVAWAEGYTALGAMALARRLGPVYRLLERQV